MERYSLEWFDGGRWVTLSQYKNLSKTKAEFYQFLCDKRSLNLKHPKHIRILPS